MKQRVFIASSVEGLEVAYAAQENLERAFEVTVWAQGAFELTKSALESLSNALRRFDAAIFVFSPDDFIVMRGAKTRRVRDNVVFELGMFIGGLGREKCFILMPRGEEEIALPSDLLGVTPATFDAQRDDGNLAAALGPACNRIKKALQPDSLRPSKEVTEHTSVEAFLTSRSFRLFFNPITKTSKVIRFGKDGYVLEGNNQNEHRWAVVNGKLEIYNLAGRTFSRFALDREKNLLTHTNDSDTLSIRDQYIVEEKGA
jgi:hypothetical protein